MFCFEPETLSSHDITSRYYKHGTPDGVRTTSPLSTINMELLTEFAPRHLTLL